MTSQQGPSRRTWGKRIGMVLVSLPGLALIAAAVGGQVHVYMLRAGVNSSDPATRTEALRQVADEREARAADAVFAVLANEQDRAVLDAAAHAAVRMRDPGGVELLQRRADEGPDDQLRAQMIGYAAYLSGRDLRLTEWLTAGVAASEPWRRAGSAAGLLQLGQPRGGQYLIDMAPELPPDVRRFAIGELRRVAEPMAEAVGRPLDFSGADGGTLTDAQWADLRQFWTDHATIALLNDVLDRLQRRDPKWFEVDRLLHARERFARWFSQDSG